jgi:hypothetical protein
MLRLLMLLFCLMAIVGCDTSATPEELAEAGLDVRNMPHVDLRPDDIIVSADLALGDGQTMHVVWNAAVQKDPSMMPRNTSYYVRSKDGGNNWTTPIVIDNSFGAPRIVASGNHLHIVAGPWLNHFTSNDGGKSWSDLGPLMPKTVKGNVSCDLAMIDASSCAIVCLVQPRTPYDRIKRSSEHRQRLLFGYIAEHSKSEFSTIATFPASVSPPPPPRLLLVDGVLHVLAGVNEDQWQQFSGSVNVPALKVVGRMYTLRSDDGQIWSNPVDLLKSDGHLEPIEAVEGLAIEGQLYAFFSANGVLAARSMNGKTWTQARQVSSYRTMISPGGAYSSLLSAAVNPSGKGLIAWIDERYRRSTSRWWNPLGGIPWSDDTQLLRNNDIFILELSQVDSLLDRGVQPFPVRVTSSMDFTRLVRFQWQGDQFVLLWVGRREVGKQLDSRGFPPEIFYSFFESEESFSESSRHVK